MSLTDEFCLQWKDFESNIGQSFRDLREEKDLFDITLVCDDCQIQAHKVILSACSTFFRTVLRRHPNPHPLIYMKGVEFKELQNILNFMYMGEVNLAHEELRSFLAVAADLKVKGLSLNNEQVKKVLNNEKENIYNKDHNITQETVVDVYCVKDNILDVSVPVKKKVSPKEHIKKFIPEIYHPETPSTTAPNQKTTGNESICSSNKSALNTETPGEPQYDRDHEAQAMPQANSQADTWACGATVNRKNKRTDEDDATNKITKPYTKQGEKNYYFEPKVIKGSVHSQPKWQCNMCARILPSKEKTIVHLQDSHQIAKSSVYGKRIKKIT